MFDYQRIYFLQLITLTLIFYSHQQDSDIIANYKKYQAECLTEGGLDKDTVMKMWKDNNFPNDDKMKCYYKCVFLKLGSMNDKGDVVDDVLKKVSAPFNDANTDTEIVVECGGIEGANLCETAYKLAICVRAAQLD